MAAPLQQVLLSLVAASTNPYIGRSQGNVSSGSYTYTSAPINSGASDIIVVAAIMESSASLTISGVTVGGNSLTQWSQGNIGGSFIAVGEISFFYGTPGAFSTANIVVSGTGGSATLIVWKLTGLNSTPVAQVGSAAAIGTSASTSNVSANSGGAVLALMACNPTETVTPSWSGSDAYTADTAANDTSGNLMVVAGHVLPTSTTTTNGFSYTISSTAQHYGGAISFGP